MAKRTNDSDALVAACKAIERSTDTKMVRATLSFLWDRYIMHPPADAWWAKPEGKRPR